jgi:hypothetical protein
LRADKESWRQQQLEALRDTQEQLAKAKVDQGEIRKLRRERAELLRLRGEVAALRRAAKASARNSAANQPGTSDTGAAPEKAPEPTRLHASIHTQVPTGQTLLTGGWTCEPCKRVFALATPSINGENCDQVLIKTKFIEVAESVLSQLGLDGFKVEGTESSLQQVFSAEQAESLLKQLRGTDGVDLLGEARMTTLGGRQVEMLIAQDPSAGGVARDPAPVMDVVPVISSDKKSIELTLQAGLNRFTPEAE